MSDHAPAGVNTLQRRRRFPRRVITSLMVATIANASPAQTISGIGARDCRALSFALDRESSEALDSYVAWSQGFISAFNWSNVRQRDVRIDASGLLHWLGQYCRANPDQSVYLAVQELIQLNAR
jgi:hypothetical protein